MSMPGTSGAHLARNLRAKHPNLPVIYVSGYTSDLLAGQELLTQRAALVRKPFSYADLMKAIVEVTEDA